jgi:PAS domain-containing protein
MQVDPATLPAPSRLGPTRWQFDASSGLTLSEAARYWFDLPDYRAHAWKQTLLPRLAKADRTRLVEALLRGLDGEAIDVQVASSDNAAPRMMRWIADASRDARSVDGMLLDVSRDARERDALLELAGLQRSFIDALPWPACAYDEVGDILLANRLWRRCADCSVELDGRIIELPELPDWLCRHRGDFAGGMAGERILAVTLRSNEGDAQPARLHRTALRQGGTPLNVLSVESRPVLGSDSTDQDEGASRGR